VVLPEGLSPGRRLHAGAVGPVGGSVLEAAQAELPPACFVQADNQLLPGSADQAAAAQVREAQVAQDELP